MREMGINSNYFNTIKSKGSLKLKVVKCNSKKTVFQPNSEQLELWSHQMDVYMAERKPYTDVRFNSATISEALDINRTYLSIVLSKIKHERFENYVNSYRINDVQLLIAKEITNNKIKYTLEYYANLVGFRSRSAFNRAFKQNTSQTPTQFINQKIQEKVETKVRNLE